MSRKLKAACGHDRFVIVSTEDEGAAMEVVGPDDLVDWFNEFAETTRLKHRCPETLTDVGGRTWTCIRHASHADGLHEDPTGGVWTQP